MDPYQNNINLQEKSVFDSRISFRDFWTGEKPIIFRKDRCVFNDLRLDNSNEFLSNINSGNYEYVKKVNEYLDFDTRKNVLRLVVQNGDVNGFVSLAKYFDIAIDDYIFIMDSLECKDEQISINFLYCFIDNGYNISVHSSEYLKKSAKYPGRFTLKKIILDINTNKQCDIDECFLTACRFHYDDDIKFWLDHGADIHADNDKALCIYIAANINIETETILFLIKNGANVNAGHGYPLIVFMRTSGKNACELIEILMENGANPDFLDREDIIYTINNRYIKKLEILAKYGYDFNKLIDKQEKYPLVEFLLQQKISLYDIAGLFANNINSDF